MVILKRMTIQIIMGLLLVMGQTLTARAQDWYWVNDAGGIWDEALSGLTGWRTSENVVGLPTTGDDALLVLPYRLPTPIPQPVLVMYRDAGAAELNQLVIESDNILLQQDIPDLTPADQIDLTSQNELIGGSGLAFAPPPSPGFEFPAIFPEGKHIQRAGSNTVNSDLILGGVAGSRGTYELSGNSAVLNVLSLETVGNSGSGQFTQTDGENNAFRLFVGSESGGDGRYDLSGGVLNTGISVIGRYGEGVFSQSAGSHRADIWLLVGALDGGLGHYLFTGGNLDSQFLLVGDEGSGLFEQFADGVNVDENLILGGEGSGEYRLRNSVLQVAGDVVVGEFGAGKMLQTGSARSLSENAAKEFFTTIYCALTF